MVINSEVLCFMCVLNEFQWKNDKKKQNLDKNSNSNPSLNVCIFSKLMFSYNILKNVWYTLKGSVANLAAF